MFNMKKTTAFFLVIGVLAMISGGIGAATFYQRAERSLITYKKEEYKIKNKKSLEEVHLNLSGNAKYVIQTEAIDKVLMETSSGLSSTIDSTLKVTEKSNQLSIYTTGNQSTIAGNKLSFGFFFDDFYPTITIKIPNNTEKIIVEGDAAGDIQFSDIITDDLAIDLNHSNLTFYQANTKTLDVKLTTGDISLDSSTRSKEISIVTKFGDLNLSDFSVEKLTVSSGTGDIFISGINGTSTIESNQGDITASNLKGEATFKMEIGSFNLNGSDFPKKLKVEVDLGDISINTDEILYNTWINASSSLGSVELFSKEITTYKQGKDSRTFELSTKTGDVIVDGPVDHKLN